ncbi:hypothetical protein B0H14DRAFT_3126256 [Mycena olivaceomarginata]|nr:hypothetical protein B0H14DRAFT_3126256 [Mycena olivaceomarginata]
MSPSPSLSSYSLSLNPSHNVSFFSPPATQSERGILSGQSPSPVSVSPKLLVVVVNFTAGVLPNSLLLSAANTSLPKFFSNPGNLFLGLLGTISAHAQPQRYRRNHRINTSVLSNSLLLLDVGIWLPETQPVSISSSFSANARPSASLPQDSSVSIAHSQSQATSLTHRPGVIAVIAATSAASQTPSFSSTPVSGSPSSSSNILTTSSSTPPQSISSSCPVNALPFTSLPQSSSSLPSSYSHFWASSYIADNVAYSKFKLKGKKRIHAHRPFMLQYTRDTAAKELASPSSTTGSRSGWPAEDVSGTASRAISLPFPLRADRPRRPSMTSLAGSAKTSHYTIRSHTSHVTGKAHSFGKDVAWKEAHYEDPGPLSVFRDRSSGPRRDISRSTPLHPEKKTNVPLPAPTLHPGVVLRPNRNMNKGSIASSREAMWLLRRSTASASSVSSVYSTASIVPETSVSHIRDPDKFFSRQLIFKRPAGAQPTHYKKAHINGRFLLNSFISLYNVV